MKKLGKILLFLAASLWSLLTLFPLITTFLSSLKTNEEINYGMFSLPGTWRWSNYSDAIHAANIGTSVLNSLFLAIVTTVVTTIIGMLTAYTISRKKNMITKSLYLLFIFGLMVPVHTTILPISNIATIMKGKNQFWFLILIYVAFQLAQAIFLYVGYLNGVDKELDEAALMDGCGDLRLLFQILFPISKPIIATEAIFIFIYGYSELLWSMLIITDQSKYTVSRGMLTFSGGYQIQLGPIFATIILSVLPMIILYILLNKQIQKGMLDGAVKG